MKNYQVKAWLKGKYLDEKLSTLKIAKLCGLNSHVTILVWLNRFKIKRRTLSEAKVIFHPRGMLGKHHSEETKKKIGASVKGRGAGRKLSDATKNKISKARKAGGYSRGEKNPNYKPKIECICSYCKKTYRVIPSIKNKTKFCSIKCRNLADKGKAAWNAGLKVEADNRIAAGKRNGRWLGGKSFEPYGLEFDRKLKLQIRARDNYRCMLCGKYENGKLHNVHHVDYCKQNNGPENLITLCRPCHTKTNGNRYFWINYFAVLSSTRIYFRET